MTPAKVDLYLLSNCLCKLLAESLRGLYSSTWYTIKSGLMVYRRQTYLASHKLQKGGKTMKMKSPHMLMLILFVSALATGCIEETGVGDESRSGSYTSSSGNDCNLQELISESDRQAANSCGIQASSQIANADTYYYAAVKACKTGETGTNPDTGATTTYRDTYEIYAKTARYALDVVGKLGCGASSSSSGRSPSLDTREPEEHFNLCVGYINNGYKAQGSCYGPTTGSSCGNSQLNFLSQYDTSYRCISARDSWLNNAFD